MRLDRAVTARHLARSRSHAQDLISRGQVLVEGIVATKASLDVGDDAHIDLVADATSHYVSRAALKLRGAFQHCVPLGLHVEGMHALDAGASTGGFTQVLLEYGAAHVLAVDVGHHQLALSVRDDPRVTAVEGFNIRDLSAQTQFEGPPSASVPVELVVADLSFISLTLVIDPLVAFAAPHADFVLMVKPQFEVGKRGLDSHGVVRKASERRDAVTRVVAHMRGAGLDIHTVSPSELPGPTGNQEYFVWGSAPWQARGVGTRPILDDAAVAEQIAHAVEGA